MDGPAALPPEPGAAPAATAATGASEPDRHTDGRPSLRERLAQKVMPHTFQGRLTLAFVAILAMTLTLVTTLVLNRLGDYFDQQQRLDLSARSLGVSQYVALVAEGARGFNVVVDQNGIVNPAVSLQLKRTNHQRILADQLAKADVRIQLGVAEGGRFVPASNGEFLAFLGVGEQAGQKRELIESDPILYQVGGGAAPFGYVVEVTLSNPYTYRASAIATTTGLLAIIGLVALALSVLAAAALARRFTTPLRRLTEASRDLAEGDLARRVPTDAASAGSIELNELALQFNAMADRVQESVDIIRRDRDRSRDFLADVSHELRTPIAALRTFNELLQEHAGEDPAARTEFLESSGVQLERLDWLAHHLLELSKLDSGLVLLDLRPDDLRATVEQAVEQAGTAARRRGVLLDLDLPGHPLRIRHDPVRIGQVVANLVGNAIKFTARGGRIDVTVAPTPEGATIQVTDTGVGIAPEELPRIFERFYRGTRASEARGSGSGLGLAIVRSIVDMHGGSVSVESRLGAGSTFTVALPKSVTVVDARRTAGTTAADLDGPSGPEAGAIEADPVFVADSSSLGAPSLNADPPR